MFPSVSSSSLIVSSAVSNPQFNPVIGVLFVFSDHILMLEVLFGSFSLLFKKNKFIYFWLCWVFVAACGLSLVVASGATLRCGAQASHCGGFSCCRARALERTGLVAPRHVGSSRTRSRTHVP